MDGYQDRIVLGGKVWIDEMYVTDSDLKGDPGWRPKKGLVFVQLFVEVLVM